VHAVECCLISAADGGAGNRGMALQQMLQRGAESHGRALVRCHYGAEVGAELWSVPGAGCFQTFPEMTRDRQRLSEGNSTKN
jgi:hypothetical protein